MFIVVFIVVCKRIFFASFRNSFREFSESFFNSFLQGSEELEFASACLWGVGIFEFSSSTETVAIVQQLLVSVNLGPGSASNTLLGDDAFVEWLGFSFQFLLSGSQTLNVWFKSFLFIGIGFNFSLFVRDNFLEDFIQVFSEGGKDGLDSVEENLVKLQIIGLAGHLNQNLK